MVLGLGSKSRKNRGSSVRVDFKIRFLEIKPWLGSQSSSSKLSNSVVLHWKRGDRHSGSTKSVVPQPGTSSDDGKIVFNESFKLPATLYRKSTEKGNKLSGNVAFQEKSVAFCLLEANNLRGPPLARATLDLSSYGAIQEPKRASIPLIVSKHVLTGAVIPNLLVNIATRQQNKSDCFDKVQRPVASFLSIQSGCATSNQCSSSVLDEHSRETLVAALLSEDDDDEIAAFTDDESSPGSTTPLHNVNAARASDARVAAILPEASESSTNSPMQERTKKMPEAADKKHERPPAGSATQPSLVKAAAAAAAAYTPKRTFPSSDKTLSWGSLFESSSGATSPGGDDGFFTPSSHGATSPRLIEGSPASHASSHISACSLSSDSVQSKAGTKNSNKGVPMSCDAERSPASNEQLETRVQTQTLSEKVTNTAMEKFLKEDKRIESSESKTSEVKLDAVMGTVKPQTKSIDESAVHLVVESGERPMQVKQSQELVTFNEAKAFFLLQTGSNAEAERKETEGIKPSSRNVQQQKHESKVQRSSMDDIESEYLANTEREAILAEEEMSVLEEARLKFAKGADKRNEKIEKRALEEAKLKVARAEAKCTASEEKVNQLQLQIDRLTGELQDVAAVEAALYCTVAEHGKSSHEVHFPARRLARLYIFACKHWSPERRASFARNSVAGLVLVAKACGHDVPRLTFWWSNAFALRETISLALDMLPASTSSATASSKLKDDVHITGAKGDARPNWEQRSQNFSHEETSQDWKEPRTFIAVLERVEAWIFAKIVESVWWQAMAPRMQKPADCSSQKSADFDGFDEDRDAHSEIDAYSERDETMLSGFELGDDMQGNISIDLWKKAFSDAFERLCPARVAGTECGCIPVLTRLVMEECVVRLDVAMFNAILRRSEDEVPTDPISDPISDPCVLPIPPGNLTFGAGAQLKNAVGTWSTWLTNLLDKHNNSGIRDDVVENDDKNFITFPLSKAIGDLLMLPKDMLAEKSVRKEVCPVLNLSVIRRILLSFVPDEFSPEPVTPSLLAAINAEISLEKQMYGDVGCNFSSQGMALSPAIVYCPQSSSVRDWIGNGITHTVFDCCNPALLSEGLTSDELDELDELEALFFLLLENSDEVISGASGHLESTSVPISEFDANGKLKSTSKRSLDYPGLSNRFKMLREVWIANSND